jgi:hypothetical protein
MRLDTCLANLDGSPPYRSCALHGVHPNQLVAHGALIYYYARMGMAVEQIKLLFGNACESVLLDVLNTFLVSLAVPRVSSLHDVSLVRR